MKYAPRWRWANVESFCLSVSSNFAMLRALEHCNLLELSLLISFAHLSFFATIRN